MAPNERPAQPFAFGKNWQDYLRTAFSEQRLQAAIESIKAFCGLTSLADLTFLDIGCGSGLFSMAAYRMGAAKVVSLDVDEKSVWCARELKKKAGSPENWEIHQGSVLDEEFMHCLGEFDFVYSWGVMHHTGDMWPAISNGGQAVRKNGRFHLAVYNKTEAFGLFPDCRFGPSRAWVPIKRIYSTMPPICQNLVDYALMSVIFILYLITFKNPFRRIARHKDDFRGMSWRHDIKDWMGGYPYEYASPDEIFAFLKERGFILENLKCYQGVGNNEYLFRKKGGQEA